VGTHGHLTVPYAEVDAVAVVVPARDEEAVLPACLQAVAAARVPVARLGVPVATVVIADSCRDQTADVARAATGVEVVESRAGTVGGARAAGVALAMRMLGGVATRRVWVACTDADSVVPRDWLSAQVAVARAGYDAVAGLIALDGAGLSTATERWRRAYDVDCGRDRLHGRVHGANLGVRGDAYRAIGGFAAVAVGEDVDLVHRLRAAGRTIAWPERPVVLTSARLTARTRSGVAADLRALA